MRTYDYTDLSRLVIDIEILSLVSRIHEYKGRQELYLETQPQTLDKLQDIAMIQSTDASNRLEGIFTSDKRLRELVTMKIEPKSRNEQEIAGYRDVLTLVHENYSYIQMTKNDILTLHNRLYSYYPNPYKGKYKLIKNLITERHTSGEEFIRFEPVDPIYVDDHMASMLQAFNKALRETAIDPLLYIPCFILDFLCIHPFNDGNGRMARLLTLLALYKTGYIVGRYISLELIIEKSKQSYYDTLYVSSLNWHENENNYGPFIKYLLSTILKAYEEFDDRHKGLLSDTQTSLNRIYKLIENSLKPLSKSDIVLLCPEVSQKTIERVLNQLKNEHKIIMIDSGRATKYVRAQLGTEDLGNL
ncbi:MAG: Fic family protein [Erysipelothrix sp.]|jgi:Fic family protein|nr:Fic family protein [Erysipelothrix sp.]